MFELLMQLPLFQGVSAEMLSTLVEKYKFHFLKFADGDTVVEAGQLCTHVRFVVSGAVRVATRCRALDVMLLQTLAAPNVLGPDSLFGVDTAYPFSATAVGTCGILQIAKADYVAMLQADKVFLFNILNRLSRSAQQLTSILLGVEQGSTTERLVRWVEPLAARAATDIVLQYTQRDLCTLLGVQRKALLAALEAMQTDGLVELAPRRIAITDLRRFINQLNKN